VKDLKNRFKKVLLSALPEAFDLVAFILVNLKSLYKVGAGIVIGHCIRAVAAPFFKRACGNKSLHTGNPGIPQAVDCKPSVASLKLNFRHRLSIVKT
jgi:hypothetical protein